MLLTVTLFSCNNKSGNPDKPYKASVLAKDGVTVSYDVRGRGNIALVFIHGWCSNRTFWYEQLDTLAQKYKVIAIDLPGHGESGRNRKKWSITSFADDVELVLESIEIKRAVLIGHSMGGLVSLKVAQHLQDCVIGIIVVDAIGDVENPDPPEAMEPFFDAFEADFKGTMSMAIPRLFSQDASAELVKWVTDNSTEADSIMALAIARDLSIINEKELLSSVNVPVRCIYSSNTRPEESHSFVITNNKYADFDAVFVDSTGHFLHLEKPEEVNKHLRNYLTELERINEK